jgi:ribosomal protein S18 acetylase RimI-like enzyme
MTSDLTIRTASIADLPLLESFEARCFADRHERFTRRLLRDLIANPNATILVAEHRAAPVGSAIALRRRHPTGYSGRIYSVAVTPDARGLGAGRRLTEALLARLADVRRVYLEVRPDNPAAIALYESLGFQRVRQLDNYYAPGRHAISYRRTNTR